MTRKETLLERLRGFTGCLNSMISLNIGWALVGDSAAQIGEGGSSLQCLTVHLYGFCRYMYGMWRLVEKFSFGGIYLQRETSCSLSKQIGDLLYVLQACSYQYWVIFIKQLPYIDQHCLWSSSKPSKVEGTSIWSDSNVHTFSGSATPLFQHCSEVECKQCCCQHTFLLNSMANWKRSTSAASNRNHSRHVVMKLSDHVTFINLSGQQYTLSTSHNVVWSTVSRAFEKSMNMM